jgi:hypothetical protein
LTLNVSGPAVNVACACVMSPGTPFLEFHQTIQ